MSSALPWPDLGSLWSSRKRRSKASPKSATWGPSHSFDSDFEDDDDDDNNNKHRAYDLGGIGIDTDYDDDDEDGTHLLAHACVGKSPLATPAATAVDEPPGSHDTTTTSEDTTVDGAAPPQANDRTFWGMVPPSLKRNMDLLQDYVGESCISAAPCVASGALNHTNSTTHGNLDGGGDNDDGILPVLGIARMTPPLSFGTTASGASTPMSQPDAKRTASSPSNDTNNNNNTNSNSNPNNENTANQASPQHQRRLERHEQRRRGGGGPLAAVQQKVQKQSSTDDARAPPRSTSLRSPAAASKTKHKSSNSSKDKKSTTASSAHPPLDTLEVQRYAVNDLDRTISELTMRSSYGGYEASLAKLPDNRRMAYYAVGKHHRQSSRGGNRRCYFTGKLILGGAPFYAGTVLQGLRTLVVFCLPSAVGLPDKEALQATSAATGGHTATRVGSSGGVITAVSPRLGAVKSPSVGSFSLEGGGGGGRPPQVESPNMRGSFLSRTKRTTGSSSIASRTIGSKSMSKFSLDDLSLSIDGDLDPNWGLDRDLLLKILPEANDDLLRQVKTLYPEQFETLPVQVRDSKRWKLFVKFCFFSGLPIAEGEMHYRVQPELAEATYGEEIVLSHDVMEAVNGAASAEILTLPNTKAFMYLRKHYSTQCSKLDERVFQRNSWERVAPEV